MRILIANLDYAQDPYNIAFSEDMRNIRKYNVRGCGSSELFDPFGETGECTLGGADLVFGYCRIGIYNGIIGQSHVKKDLYTDRDGYPAINIQRDKIVNPVYMPFLSQDTLVAYMPQIPWDDFGNHLRLEGDDAEQFIALWNTFIQQNKDLYNKVYRLEYPVDEAMSNMSFIFMDKEIE